MAPLAPPLISEPPSPRTGSPPPSPTNVDGLIGAAAQRTFRERVPSSLSRCFKTMIASVVAVETLGCVYAAAEGEGEPVIQIALAVVGVVALIVIARI